MRLTSWLHDYLLLISTKVPKTGKNNILDNCNKLWLMTTYNYQSSNDDFDLICSNIFRRSIIFVSIPEL